jgi:integrase
MIAEVLAAYGNEVAPNKASARNMGYMISSLLKWWGEKRVADITKKSCREYIKSKSEQSAGQDLKILRIAVKHWHGEYGPLDAMPIFEIPDGYPPRERWLTRPEAARLLWAARRHLHLRRLILLGLYTGSRSGVLLRLRWAQIDFGSGIMSRLPAGMREDKKKRAPKVKLGRRILAHLKRWKRLDGEIKLVCHFTGREIGDPHHTWKKIVKAAGLPGVTRHTLRHTRATWMMQAGIPIWEAAGFLGMTVKTLEKVYGHHSPDHQEAAANI